MALTISTAGSNNSTTSGATLQITGVTAAVGDWLVIAISSDNQGGGGQVSLSSVQDSASNTWEQRSITNNDPGAAGAGITLGIFTAKITNALSSGSVTVNFSPNTTSKAAALFKVTPGAGEEVAFRAAGPGATATSSTAQTITATAVQNGDTIFGAVALESNALPTADSDTTNGSWSAAHTANANTGTAATSTVISSQHKTVNATGDQTYNTSSSSADIAINWITLFASQLLRGHWAINGITTKNA